MKSVTINACLTFISVMLCIITPANAVDVEPISSNETEVMFKAMSGETVAAMQGWLAVPENRQKADSRKIRLNYVRFASTNPKNKNASPIVYLSGGPGGSGITTAKHQRFPLFMAMREFGDVIAFDQRGIDEGRLPCQSTVKIPSAKAIDDQSHIALQKRALKQCLSIWQEQGIDIYGYTTRESALDLDALRVHLNAQEVSLWGISYGSHLALAALKEMSGKIDRVVIASVEGLDQTIKMPLRTNAYFARLQAAVNGVPALKAKYPKIHLMVSQVHAQLDKAPLALAIPENGKAVDIVFQKRDMQSIAAGMIADPGSALKLLALYTELLNGEHGMLIELLSRYTDPERPISFFGMSVAMDLASGISEPRLALVMRQIKTGLLADRLNFGLHHFDDIAGIDLGDAFRVSPISDVPTLVLSGTLDGRTYLDSQSEAVADLANAHIVVVENAGHNLFMTSDKVSDVIRGFMRGDVVDTKTITVDLPTDLSAN